jgi:hypothetical protein
MGSQPTNPLSFQGLAAHQPTPLADSCASVDCVSRPLPPFCGSCYFLATQQICLKRIRLICSSNELPPLAHAHQGAPSAPAHPLCVRLALTCTLTKTIHGTRLTPCSYCTSNPIFMYLFIFFFLLNYTHAHMHTPHAHYVRDNEKTLMSSNSHIHCQALASGPCRSFQPGTPATCLMMHALILQFQARPNKSPLVIVQVSNRAALLTMHQSAVPHVQHLACLATGALPLPLACLVSNKH